MRGGAGRGPWSRAQRAGAALLLAGSALFLIASAAWAPGVPFVRQGAEAPWIAPDAPVSAALQQWGSDDVPRARFARRFELAQPPARAPLRVCALRRFVLFVNGARAAAGGAADRDGSWRETTRLDVARWLRAGTNEIAVEVWNAHGPPLLSLRLDGPAEPVRSDTRWSVSIDGGPFRSAALADDTRRNPSSFAGATPLEALVSHADDALFWFLLGALGFLAGRRTAPQGFARTLPLVALAAAVAAWLGLFAGKWVRIPLEVGFDARHHLAYVELLRAKRAVPLATDGWSTFHPPLFYAASLWAGASRTALKLLPLLGGLGTVFAAFALARRLLPDDPRAQAYAVVFAAVLPMNLYSSAYFSNESLHTLLASLAILAAVAALLAARASPGRAALAGALFGLAALTKFTVLAVVPLALGFLVIRWWALDRAPPARLAALAAAFALPFLALAGWFYVRNVIVYGDPLLANWGGMPGDGHRWWQQPGFHTPAYFTRFGEALVHPYLSGFASFWDSVYSTFWGDGFVAGRVLAADRHGFWSYDWMSAGYLLALPATALLAWGAVRAVREALAPGDPHRRAALSFLATATWLVGLAFLYLALRLAFYSQAKATYLLLLTGPLALFFALGAARADDLLARWLPARAALHGWLFLFAAALFLGFAG